MRKIRDVLRYRHSTGLSLEAIARALQLTCISGTGRTPPRLGIWLLSPERAWRAAALTEGAESKQHAIIWNVTGDVLSAPASPAWHMCWNT